MYSLNASTSFKTLKKALTLTTSLVSDQRPIIMGRYTEDFEEKELLVNTHSLQLQYLICLHHHLQLSSRLNHLTDQTFEVRRPILDESVEQVEVQEVYVLLEMV
ncbi:uncharacterized protein LOC107769732 isoform X4 [Nicotiana tabacum]|uniref:Uncharacterized protein LOC107769732 isoform X4 n=1 Tax=Nicotiana tabacum TaxID=4097 RepID=A0AC58TBD7_TOBAC